MTKENTQSQPQPKDWLSGLKENFDTEIISGFIISLLALPLSLGIAKAAGIPPIMGVISAISGGILITFVTGCKLSIKGPAAGLIVIVAGAVSEFGGGVEGWKMAAGAMVIAGLVQILLGITKLGKFVDFFPLSAIHGMLAAIGIIIVIKQIPVLLNISPSYSSGKGPIKLLVELPKLISNLDLKITLIGLTSLTIMMVWPLIKNKWLKKIPAPLLVLLFSIPMGVHLDLSSNYPDFTLLKIGEFSDSLKVNSNFNGINEISVFIKYVLMLALVGSLESLLTVKAIDLLDPYKRKSDPNKDLIAIGIGNSIVGILGGYPMISEVARSSANISTGAKTRWANFFHGIFLLLFVVFAYSILEMIPNSALAAMLIAVGLNLAHPREFVQMSNIGKDQLAIFLTTIIVTLFEDLLVGIAAGIILKLVIHVIRGVRLRYLFNSSVDVSQMENSFLLAINDSALFSNYLGIKKHIDAIPPGKQVIIHFRDNVKLVDHSFIENLEHFKHDYEQTGGRIEVVGLEKLSPLSNHNLSARKR